MHLEGARPGGPANAGAGPRIEALGSGLGPCTTPVSQTAQEIVLRSYQVAAIDDVRAGFRRGASRVALQSPTGSGKTELFCFMIERAAARGRRVCVLVHRVELIDQVDRTLRRRGVEPGIIAPGHDDSGISDVQIASIASLARPERLKRWRDAFDFLVVDEAHHAVAGSWAKVLASQPRAHILGVTATPERLDGKGLGEVFQELVIGPSVAELIAAGWLAPFIVFEPIAGGPDLRGVRIRGGDYAVEDLRDRMNGVVVGAAVREYLRLCAGVPAVAFCVDVSHSQAVAEAFGEAGVAGHTPRWRNARQRAPERDCGPRQRGGQGPVQLRDRERRPRRSRDRRGDFAPADREPGDVPAASRACAASGARQGQGADFGFQRQHEPPRHARRAARMEPRQQAESPARASGRPAPEALSNMRGAQPRRRACVHGMRRRSSDAQGTRRDRGGAARGQAARA